MLFYITIAIIVAEMYNYLHYRRVYNFIKNRRYFNNKAWHTMEIVNMLKTSSVSETKKYIMTWLRNKNDGKMVSWDDVKSENIYRAISYALYLKSMWQLNDEEFKVIDDVYDAVKEKLGDIPTGKNDDIYLPKFGSKNIRSFYKPLIYFGIAKFLSYMIHIKYTKMGFTTFRSKDNILFYMKKTHDNDDYVMFIHGFGIGIGPYIDFLGDLSKEHNIIAPILPNISHMDYISYNDIITDDKLFPSNHIFTSNIEDIIDNFNMNKLTMIGHSFGTIMMSMLLRSVKINNHVNKNIFIEPVCFWQSVTHTSNYIDMPYKTRDSLLHFFLSCYCIYSDIYIRYVTDRYLYGPDYWLNASDDHDNIFFLSEHDELSPSNKIIEGYGDKVSNIHVIENAYHGNLFYMDDYNEYQNEIMRLVKS